MSDEWSTQELEIGKEVGCSKWLAGVDGDQRVPRQTAGQRQRQQMLV